MTELQNVLDRYLDMELLQIVLSGARTKDGVSRIRIRPVIIREELLFQCTKTAGTKEKRSAFKDRSVAAGGFSSTAAGEWKRNGKCPVQ